MVAPVQTGKPILYCRRNSGMLFAVFLSSSEAPRKTTPLLLQAFSASTIIGISSRHGMHHVAQKLSTTTLPRRLLRLTFAPSRVVSVRSTGFSGLGAL